MKRRDFMKWIGYTVAGVGTAGFFLSAGPVYHTVESGEHLTKIAREHPKQGMSEYDRIQQIQSYPGSEQVVPTPEKDHLVVIDGKLTKGRDELTDRLTPGMEIQVDQKSHEFGWLLLPLLAYLGLTLQDPIQKYDADSRTDHAQSRRKQEERYKSWKAMQS